jgi:hypothetical protein
MHSYRQNEAIDNPSLPVYEVTAAPDTSSLNVDTACRWPTPTALLPQYGSSTSFWMRREALKVLETSRVFDDIRLIIKFVPGLDSTIAAALLSSRSKPWLGAFWNVLCRREAARQIPCDKVTAEAIVALIKRRPLAATPEWNGAWIFSALALSQEDIAQKLDAQIHHTFCGITFDDWVAWFHGFSNDFVQSFLNAVFNFRNDLVEYVKHHDTMVNRHEKIVDRLQWVQNVSLYSCIRLSLMWKIGIAISTQPSIALDNINGDSF